MLNFSVCENKYNFCHHLILTASMTNQEWKNIAFFKISYTQKKNLITNITYIKTTTVFVIKDTTPSPPITSPFLS